jgi:hypothetical protein
MRSMYHRLPMPLLLHPLTLQLWHERLNHRALDAVEHAVQHVEGLTIDSKNRPPHHCPAYATGKQHHDPFPASSAEFIGRLIAAWRKEHGIQAQHKPQSRMGDQSVASGT